MTARPIDDENERRRPGQTGLGAVDGLMLVVLLGALAAIAVPVYSESVLSGQREAFLAQTVALNDAFESYHAATGAYPAAYVTTHPGDPAHAKGVRPFSRVTLEPLTSTVDLGRSATLLETLSDGRVSAYRSPAATGGSEGDGSQFWAVISLADDPGFVVLIADTDQYPGHEGRSLKGIYLLRGNEIVTYRKES